MAESLVIELLKPFAEKLGSEGWKRIADAANVESRIKELKDIRHTIEATLLDADSAHVSSHSERDVLEKLERALAKLIDFEDAKAAKAKQKQLMGGTKFTKEVRLFCSTSNQLISPFRDARKIKCIKGELSRIERNHAQFGSIVSSSSLNQTRTLSSVSGPNLRTDLVIGRDGDRDKMVSLLLDSSAAAGVLPVASFVGIGGVGKTTLARYVYHDERIKRYFDLQLWVSATHDFNVKDVLRRIVTCATKENALDYEIDQLQGRLFQAIAGKRFLLVLDGVWDDDRLRDEWMELETSLVVGAQGSQVLLTTRSETVAKVIGTHDPLIVSDLRDDDSLLLFRHVAITKWHEPGVEAIGKDIAERCPKVPLVIRVIGSLLAGKPTVKEWRAFRDDQLANFASYGRDVISTLKLSYDQLGARQKLCVLYCSLFPKGFTLNKNILIRLWIAMGYVKGGYANQSLEAVAEGYVLCLLNRGFFYCNFRNEFKCPEEFEMHNLMHDLVLSIGGYKYKMADRDTNEFDERVCHVSYHLEDGSSLKVPSSLFKIKQLQSFLLPLPSMFSSNKQVVFPLNEISIFRIESLRVLRIHGLGINKLPKSVGKLIHLRYLDFSDNPIRKLPESITQLVNLYLLDLSWCESLEELPEDINKLVMLRHLNLVGCDNLSHLPKGLGKLTGLETLLGHFVVGKPRTCASPYGSKAKLACDLADLGCLSNLKGGLRIVLVDRSEYIVSEAKAANLDQKKITKFIMEFRESSLEDEEVLENLKPGADLEELTIKNYGGKRLPSWMREDIHYWLPKLVQIKIVDCKECINMGSFGRLPLLESLYLERLDKVEYIENGSSNKSNMVLVANEQPSTPLFPSLVQLILKDIPELKGWWSMTECAQDQSQNQLLNHTPAFPKLKFVIMDMELVISLAKELLQGISYLRYLSVYGKTKVVAEATSTPSNVVVEQRQPVILLKNYLPRLFQLSFYNNHEMEHLPEEFRGMSSLIHLTIVRCEALEAVPEWIDTLTSLQSLSIEKCPRLKSLPHEMSNLSNLKTLYLEGCSRELAERCQSPSGEDWPKIQHIPNITIQPAKIGEQ